MFPGFQSTIRHAVSCDGVGVHSGAPARLVLHPAPAGHGIVFRRLDVSDRDPLVPARFDSVGDARLGTTLVNASGVSIATVEHLLAALSGLAIDNALVTLDGPELPIMDGSSQPFVFLLECAGVTPLPAPRRYLSVTRPVAVEERGATAALEPFEGYALDVGIDFPSPIGRQRVQIDLGAEGFKRAVGPARTFGFRHEGEMLRAQGRGLGASLDNTLVIDGDSLMNPGALRFRDEFARHKALDAVGDMALAGAPLLARYVAHKGGHALNNKLLRALFAAPDAFAWIEKTPASAAA